MIEPGLGDALVDARRRLEALALDDTFNPAAPRIVVEAGLGRIVLPRDAGGFGADLREAADVVAAIAAVDGSVGLGFAMHVHVVGAAVASTGWRPAARNRLLAAVRDGALVNNAATEEAGGSPARGAIPETVAEPEGDGYRLSGEKTWTTWLPALGYAMVSARLGPSGDGDVPRVGAFLVDLTSPGVSRLPAFDALGMRGSASGRLVLDRVRVEPEDVAAIRRASESDPRGPGAQAWFGIIIGATYLGVGEGARDAVVRWAIDRRPGDGSTTVADVPSVQVRLGRLDADLRAARIVLLGVADRWSTTPPEAHGVLLADVALAKVVATTAAVRATDQALRIAGGPGFLAGRLERAFRDARAGLINPPLEDVAYQGFAKTLIERASGQG
jgi:alkylation response protein AidB-like acyl-CoA dehydrogenase